MKTNIDEIKCSQLMRYHDVAVGYYKLFKEYSRVDGVKEYEYYMGADRLDILWDFVKAVSGHLRFYSYVITSGNVATGGTLKVLARFPSTEVL